MNKLDIAVMIITLLLAIYTSVLYFADTSRVIKTWNNCKAYYEQNYDCTPLWIPPINDTSLLENLSFSRR